MTDVTVESRTALIEGYAGKAADITRTVISKGFATADSVKAFLAKPKAQATAAVTKAKTTATTWWVTTRAKIKSAKPAKEAAPS